MKRIHLYFRRPAQKDRFFIGDRYIIPALRRAIKKSHVSGIEKVFINLCKGLDELNIDYDINLPFKKIQPAEPVIVLGLGKFALEGYKQPNPIIAGIGLMTHPHEWPYLFEEYPVDKYLQHSSWTQDIYVPYYEAKNCIIWPAGIDTKKWQPKTSEVKKYDLLIYNKIMWNKPQTEHQLKTPILQHLDDLGISYREITYGQYDEDEYYAALQQCRGMIFLCEHESQGFACCEALSMNVPVLAWNQGYWLDPNRFKWNETVVPATSVPWFDERCGMIFKDLNEFNKQLNPFMLKLKTEDFTPREYVLENLTLKISAQKMLEIVNSVYFNSASTIPQK